MLHTKLIFIFIILQIRIYEVRAYLCLNHAITLFSHLGHYIFDVELQQDDSNFILSIQGRNISPKEYSILLSSKRDFKI